MSIAAIGASLAAGAGSSLVNNWMSEDGEQGYDLPMLTNSPWDAGNMRLMGQMGQQGAINAEAGRLPPGMEIMLDKIRKRQLEESKRQMFGDPGDRGGSIMDSAMSAGAQSGVGPKALNRAIVPKAMNDYASRNSQIRNYIDSLKYSGLQKSRTESFNQMNSMPRSNEIPYRGQVIQQNTPGRQGNVDLSGIDYQKLTENWNTPWSSQNNTTAGQYDPQGGGYFTGGTVNSGGVNYPITSPPNPNQYRPGG